VVAIGGTLCYHDKYLVARGGLSIATLNVVVAIGRTLYYHKYLVARGGLSIATTNVWLLKVASLLPRLLLCCYSFKTLLSCLLLCCYSLETLLPYPLFRCYEVFCHIVCLLL
jgi:hypothetical protein